MFVEIEPEKTTFAHQEDLKKYQSLIDILSSYLYLADYRLYIFKAPDEYETEAGILVFIGRTIYGDWLGILNPDSLYIPSMTDLSDYYIEPGQLSKYEKLCDRSKGNYKIFDSAINKPENKVLVDILNKPYLSHNRYLNINWEIVETKATLIHNLTLGSHAIVVTELDSIKTIADHRIQIDRETKINFLDFVESYLTDVKVYLFINHNPFYEYNFYALDLYIVGRRDRNWIIINRIIKFNELFVPESPFIG